MEATNLGAGSASDEFNDGLRSHNEEGSELRRRRAGGVADAGAQQTEDVVVQDYEGEGGEEAVKKEDEEPAPPAAEPPEPEPAPADAKQCKICLGGEEPELGRLISPCKCKGTIKYVHLECLNQWRKASQNPHSYYQCDNCKYKYNLRRTTMSSYLRSRWVRHALALLSLAVIVWLSGYVWKIIDYNITPEEEREWQSWWVPDVNHILSGLILVGLAGFMQMTAFMVRGPLPLLGRGGGGGNDGGVGAVLFGIVVFIGLCRATLAIYKMVERLSRRALEKADDLVVDVN